MMSNFIRIVAIAVVLVIIVGVVLMITKEEVTVEITSFEECAAAGNPVMESYPRQCRAGDKTFVEDIGNELEKLDLIRVSQPRPNQTIGSPFTIDGEARGFWFFEGDFPIRLLNDSEEELAVAIATANPPAGGDWMTEDFVPFEAQLLFDRRDSESGILIFEKDNPSGLLENDDELVMPVKFKQQEDSTRSGISGIVIMGPTCPVIREGMEEECADKPYQAEVVIKDESGESEITRFTTHKDGTFSVELESGTYILDPLEPEGKPFPNAGNQTVIVEEGEFTDVAISYDTGIR